MPMPIIDSDIQIKELAILTSRLFYADDVQPGKASSFQNQFDLVSNLARQLIAINPNCSTALRYLAHSIKSGASIVEQDLVGTEFVGYPLTAMNLVCKNELVAILCRRVLSINPSDQDALYVLSFLIFEEEAQAQASDFIGTPLEGCHLQHNSLEHASVLTRKLLKLYKQSRDGTYYVAYRQLCALLQYETVSLENEDLKGTLFEGQDVTQINRQDLVTELLAKIDGFDEIESISNALARYNQILEESIILRKCDMMRASFVSDRAASLTEIEKIATWQGRQYLEVEYIKQARLLLLSGDLSASASSLFEDSTIPITDRLVAGTKWADDPLDQINRYELIAEYCRLALQCDPGNTLAIRTLSSCISKDVHIERNDLRGTAFARQSPAKISRNKLCEMLDGRLRGCNAKIQRYSRRFLNLSLRDGNIERPYTFNKKGNEEEIKPIDRKKRHRKK